MSIESQSGRIIFKCDRCHVTYDSGVREFPSALQPSKMSDGTLKNGPALDKALVDALSALSTTGRNWR
jgi:hypothetical protein